MHMVYAYILQIWPYAYQETVSATHKAHMRAMADQNFLGYRLILAGKALKA